MSELETDMSVLFEINGRNYIFDGNEYEVMRLTDTQREIFKYIKEEKKYPVKKEWAKELYVIMKKVKQGFFFTEKPVKFYGMQKAKNYIVSFPIVHRCNFRCKYCFAEGGEVYEGENKETSAPIMDGIVNFLKELSQNDIEHVRLEFVSGGETFLMKEKFFQIVDYLKKKLSEENIPLTVFALTNGTTLDSSVTDYVNHNSIQLGISLDGNKELHDFQRPYVSGKGTYDDVISNMNKFVGTGGHSKNIWSVSVITAKTDSLIKLLEHHIGLGINSMEMRVVRGKDKYGLSLTESTIEHFEKLYTEFAEYLCEHKDKIIYIFNQYDSFGKIIYRLFAEERVLYRCQAGRAKFSFTADGDIFPCDSFVGINEMKLGNVFTGERNEELMDRFQKQTVFENEHCSKCAFKMLCGGDCYYNAFVKPDEEERELYCRFQKHLMELAIMLKYEIKAEDPGLYEKLMGVIRIRELKKEG